MTVHASKDLKTTQTCLNLCWGLNAEGQSTYITTEDYYNISKFGLILACLDTYAARHKFSYNIKNILNLTEEAMTSTTEDI